MQRGGKRAGVCAIGVAADGLPAVVVTARIRSSMHAAALGLGVLCSVLLPAGEAAAQLMLQGAQPARPARKPAAKRPPPLPAPPAAEVPAAETPAGTVPSGSGASEGPTGDAGAGTAASGPATTTIVEAPGHAPRPTVASLAEPALLGAVLLHNGGDGAIRLEKGPAGVTARVTLVGRKPFAPDEPCQIELGGGEGLPLAAQGDPNGLPRYLIQIDACPIAFDAMGDALIAEGPETGCVFGQGVCRVDPAGLWGPSGSGLGGRLREIERARAKADLAMRDTFRRLSARVKGPDVRRLAADQARFSSRRVAICADYVGEDTHGFCATRLTQARAAQLKSLLDALPPPEPRAKTVRPSGQ